MWELGIFWTPLNIFVGGLLKLLGTGVLGMGYLVTDDALCFGIFKDIFLDYVEVPHFYIGGFLYLSTDN